MIQELYSAEDIQDVVGKLAANINLRVHNPCIWIIMRGGFVFAADLIRKLKAPLTLKFLDIERGYETGPKPPRTWVRITDPLEFHTKFSHVFVDVICETGTTFNYIYEKLLPLRQHPSAEKVALVVKGVPTVMPTSWGFWYKGNEFLTGYGMGPYRHLPYIAEHIRR